MDDARQRDLCRDVAGIEAPPATAAERADIAPSEPFGGVVAQVDAARSCESDGAVHDHEVVGQDGDAATAQPAERRALPAFLRAENGPCGTVVDERSAVQHLAAVPVTRHRGR